MFELYGTPRLLYCVDSVMSFYQNSLPLTNSQFVSDGLVISFNTASTSVIPVLSGKGILSHCKRCLDHRAQFYTLLTNFTQDTLGCIPSFGLPPKTRPAEISKFPYQNHDSTNDREY